MTEGADIMRLPIAPCFSVVTPDYRHADGIGLLDEAELLEVGIEVSWDMRIESNPRQILNHDERVSSWGKASYSRVGGDSRFMKEYTPHKDCTKTLSSPTTASFILIMNPQNAQS
jgi:hypothetical protein